MKTVHVYPYPNNNNDASLKSLRFHLADFPIYIFNFLVFSQDKRKRIRFELAKIRKITCKEPVIMNYFILNDQQQLQRTFLSLICNNNIFIPVIYC